MLRSSTAIALGMLVSCFALTECNWIMDVREGRLGPISGENDADLTDAAVMDAGAADAGTDAAVVDASAADAGADAAVVDAGAADASTDAGSDGGTHDASVVACPPYDLPADCQAPYLSDPKNCCVPGRDCQGGECDNGHCLPVVIVPSLGDVAGINVSGEHIVWASAGGDSIHCSHKDGSGHIALFDHDPGNFFIYSIATAKNGRVYWNEYGAKYVKSVPVGDSTAIPWKVAHLPVDGYSETKRVAVDDSRVYWVSASSPPGIWTAPLDGDDVTAASLSDRTLPDGGVISEVINPFSLAIDEGYLYWSDVKGIFRRSLASSAGVGAESIVEGTNPYVITVDQDRVYWVTSDGIVGSKRKDGGGQMTGLATGQIKAEYIVVDDRFVYWTCADCKAVRRTAKTGGGPVESIAANQLGPWGLAQDCTTLYFTDRDGQQGRVVKVAK